MSENFGKVDLTNLVFPAVLRVDYVRVYQDTDQLNIGCDPPLYPTADYIGRPGLCQEHENKLLMHSLV